MLVNLLCAFALMAFIGVLFFGFVFWGLRQKTRLPVGAEVVFQDTDAAKPGKVMVSEKFGLKGRPDYLLKIREGHKHTVVPLEDKPLRVAARPYQGDVLQLAAYLMLVEENFSKRPPFGLLRYRNETFTIYWDDDLRKELLEVMQKIRDARAQGNVWPVLRDSRKCRACSLGEVCDRLLSERVDAKVTAAGLG